MDLDGTSLKADFLENCDTVLSLDHPTERPNLHQIAFK